MNDTLFMYMHGGMLAMWWQFIVQLNFRRLCVRVRAGRLVKILES